MTDQPVNPLIAARKQPVTRDLDSYCAWINGQEWVRRSGQPYFIAQRPGPQGTMERYLAR